MKAVELAVVIPTLNERGNIQPLLEKLEACLEGVGFEVVFVDDDSSDGTPELIRSISLENDRVRLIRRYGLGLGKRAHELAWAERTGQATETRAALAGYNIPVVRAAMLVLSVATCAAYVAYTVDPHTVAFFGTDRLPYSSPFVALGIIRFLFLALWWPKDESPTEAMLKDPWFLLDLVAATVSVLYIIYG